jgi:hypothetical protein
MTQLGDRITDTEARRFVGRAEELGALRQAPKAGAGAAVIVDWRASRRSMPVNRNGST